MKGGSSKIFYTSKKNNKETAHKYLTQSCYAYDVTLGNYSAIIIILNERISRILREWLVSPSVRAFFVT